MGEDTCARAKVLAKREREARNLHAFSWRLIFARNLAATLMLFCSRLPPAPPFNASNLIYVTLIAELHGG